MTLNELAGEIHKTAVEHGWWEPQCSHDSCTDSFHSVTWCKDCGAIRTGPEEDWFIPAVSSERNFGEVLMLIVSEAAEALEEWRDGMPVSYRKPEELEKPEGVGIEMADIIIRTLDFMAQKGWDIDSLIAEKRAYNETRPYRHGGKLA